MHARLVPTALAVLAASAAAGCASSPREQRETQTASAPPGRTTAAPPPSAAERRLLAERRRTEAPRFGRSAPDASRAALVADVRRSVLADARRRTERGELRGRFKEVDCDVLDDDAARVQRDPEAPVLRYSCLAVSYRSTAGPSMVIGRPFAVRVDFARRRYAWCLFTPVGGEGTHAASTFAVQPSPACVAPPR